MPRLNKKAWKILVAEVERTTDDLAGVQRMIVLKRLEKLRFGSGSLATEAELRYIVSDILPQFSDKAIKRAAKANRPPGPLNLVPTAVVSLAGIAGLLWVVNLPYPMIRRPVARTAPILLLPSYINMDRNYREAIAHVEQADQLVNHVTSRADLELGEEKVIAAQKNLETLPVWFLGYEPQAYCRFFGCTWRFTLDEFQVARANLGRMEAKIFQEKNAIAELETLEANLEEAKQHYYRAKTSSEQQQAMMTWQTSMTQLEKLPASTLAGKNAQITLNAAQQDFQRLSNSQVNYHF